MSLFIAFLGIQSIAISFGQFLIDNAIRGEPNINCGAESVTMRFGTSLPFTGRVYAKGRYTEPECRKEFFADDRTNAAIRIQLGMCGMRKKREVAKFATIFHGFDITAKNDVYSRNVSQIITSGSSPSNAVNELDMFS